MALNPNLRTIETDFLYHLGLNTKDHNMQTLFGNVKFACLGGSTRRMTEFAGYVQRELGLENDTPFTNLASATDRYVLFKVGPVLIADHGVGVPSLCVILHELFKLLHYAGCTDVVFFRIGTCGSLGIEAGTVIVTEKAVDGNLSPNFDSVILGRKVSRPALTDPELARELLTHCRRDDAFTVERGDTMCTNDFYEGQGRLDGAFCEFSDVEKMAHLRELYNKGIRNIEMESHCFAAMCHHAGFKCAVVCVSIVNRFHGDQLAIPVNILYQWEGRPAALVVRLIKARLQLAENRLK